MARNCCVLAITQSPLATHFQASARRLNGSVGGALCRLIQQRVIENKVAGRQGFEPRYADPESAVLPLDDLPTGHPDRSKWGCLILSSDDFCG